LPEGKLRDLLSRSVTTSSNEGGGYELRVPLLENRGTVVVSATGREMQTQAVSHDPRGANEAAPETAKNGEPSSDVEMNFTLEPAGTVSGRVTDKVTGEPVRSMAVVVGLIDSEAPAMRSLVKATASSAASGT